MRRTVIGSLVGGIAALVMGATPALAASGYSLFGDATLTSGHNSPTGVQLRSSPTVPPGYGGIDFAVPAGTTFADLTNLATDFKVTEGDCGGGAPRFSIDLTNGASIFAYLGTAPSYTGCASTWSSTGNLLAGTNTVDTGQLSGGTFYDSLVHAYSAYGSLTVSDIAIVVDADWFVHGNQTVVVDDVNVNGTIYTFESAATCKDNGWQLYGGTFKNQGDCVSFFATGGKNS